MLYLNLAGASQVGRSEFISLELLELDSLAAFSVGLAPCSTTTSIKTVFTAVKALLSTDCDL
jgi:hypothetical protein